LGEVGFMSNNMEKIINKKIPEHIAIIMDGNGRWAKKRLMPRTMGHRAGMSALKKVVTACVDFNIPVLTVFAFSTENWKRPSEEIDYLMKLLVEFLRKEIEELHMNNIKINVLGDYRVLNSVCIKEIEDALALTHNNDGLLFNIALNYGSRDEIIRAVKFLAQKVANGEVLPDDINQNMFEELLYTSGIPDPDLIIRTAGEMRLSNFLMWQSAYAELWVTDKMWPDFAKEDLYNAINAYQNRDRRFGGLNNRRQDG